MDWSRCASARGGCSRCTAEEPANDPSFTPEPVANRPDRPSPRPYAVYRPSNSEGASLPLILFLLPRARYPRWVRRGAGAPLFGAHAFTAGADRAARELISANTLGVLSAAVTAPTGFR